MMNKKVLSAAIVGAAMIAVAGNSKKDPVLMTIDNRDVPLSEFKYLYNKNNSQQLQPLTFEQYVEMFVDYKLKVADALSQGVDTTQQFRQEFNKFRDELAAPFLRDSAEQERLVLEAYSHLAEDVYVSHIMLPMPSAQTPHSEATLDSLRTLIVNGQANFEDIARQYSIDKGSASNGGRMGWVTGNSRLPWQFENMAYATEVGQISPIVNSGYGLHIIRPEMRRKAKGEVSAQHILLLTKGKTPEEAEQAKLKIDSIYKVVTTPGVDFSDVAMRESQDPGSARKGGDLGWFGAGRMVAEFDSVAFALADDEISAPFATAYGYHIIHKTGHRGDVVPPLEQVRESIEKSISSDSRAHAPIAVKVNQLAQESGSEVNPNLSEQVAEYMSQKGYAVYDSVAMADLKASDIVAFHIGSTQYTIGQALQKRPIKPGTDAATAAKVAGSAAQAAFEAEILEYGRAQLMLTNQEYRNLINEYRDGIMLFEVSNQKVWDRAAKDTEGLAEYFNANRQNYTWEAPRYKAVVVFTNNDSILQKAQAFAKEFDAAKGANAEAFTADIKKRFGKDVKVERVIAAQGENAITDYLGFGQPKPEPQGQRWSRYFAYGAKVIDAPEEAADVKGLVITDYQNQLEREWVDSLRRTHTVKINKKVLKQAK